MIFRSCNFSPIMLNNDLWEMVSPLTGIFQVKKTDCFITGGYLY